MSKVKEICLNPRTLKKMHGLRFFKFYTSIVGENRCKVHDLRSLEPVFNELRYFHWDGYPLKSLPSKISPEHLVSLEMRCSNIEQLWNGVQNLPALKRLNLRHSQQLTRIPDLSQALNLEKLILEDCSNLIEIHSSIQHLNKLVFLDLSSCISLKSLPTGINLDSLKRLFLQGCKNFKRFPEISCNIEVLNLWGTAIEELPSSIGNLSRLKSLYLWGCLKLEKLPDEIGNLESLTSMLAEQTAICQIPSSIACLNKLHTLYFRGWLQTVLKLPSSFQLPNLVYLSLIRCGITELPESLVQSPSLKLLNLSENNFENIPFSIKQLSKFLTLAVANCERLQSLPELPCGSKIFASQCTSLETLSNLSSLFTASSQDCQKLYFGNCFKLNRNVVREIVEEALKRIQAMATWWNECYAFLCYPGSEIPEWFRFRSMGSSVTLELPPGWFNNNFVSFALCAIVPEYHGDARGLHIQCKLKTEDGDARDLYFPTAWNDNFGGNSSIESDHVLLGLGYDLSVFSDSFSGSNNEIYIHFYIRDGRGKCIEGLNVKKCGAHLIYAQAPRKRLRSEVEEDLGTEYLVRPVGRPEDEEDASDFEPEENGEEEDVREEGEDEDDDEGAGKVEAPSKRKRSDRDDDGRGEDDERPSKR